jgi:hypothetical protein
MMVFGDEWQLLADDGEATDHPTLTNKFLVVIAIIIGLFSLTTLISQTSYLFAKRKDKATEMFWRSRHALVSDLTMFYGNSYSTTTSFDFSNVTRTDFEKLLSQDEIKGDEIQFFQWCLRQDFDPSRTEQVDIVRDIESNIQSDSDTGGLSWISRMKVFLKWSNVKDILLPGATFERVLFGIEKNDHSPKRLLCRLVTYFICFPICLLVLFLVFCLGLISLGLLWPKRMSLFLFGGPITVDNDESLYPVSDNTDLEKIKVQNQRALAIIERQKHADMQRILHEMKLLKESLQK